jgi:hypothetical protein
MSGQGNGRGDSAAQVTISGTNGRAHSHRWGAAGPGLVIGRILSVAGEGACLVEYEASPGRIAVEALTTIRLSEQDAGREATLAFVDGDPERPVVLGLLQERRAEPAPWKIEVKGTRIVLSAAEEVVLRCGKSSITLTRAGKVLIRGAYVSSRASGVNRIKGASVQIN